MKKPKSKRIICASAVVFGVNLVLFLVKLFIGLSSNSIGVYSDAVNNLFDSLSGALAGVSFFFAGSSLSLKKAEELLSFVLSCIVAFSGIYFLVSSAERMMYPTPVWYTKKFFVLLLVTACVKPVLFFVLKAISEKDSPLIRLMATDSLLDFFVSACVLMSFVLTKNGKYAVDAVCGIAVSISIIVVAIRNIIKNAKLLTGYIGGVKRDLVENLLQSESAINKIVSLDFANENLCVAQVVAEECFDSEALCRKIKEKTEIEIFIKVVSEDEKEGKI